MGRGGGRPQLEFLNAAVRYYPSKDKVSLERIGFVDILSAVPHSRLLKPFSWKANVAIGRMRFASDDRPLTGQLNAGVGLSYDLPSKALVFAFAEGHTTMNAFAILKKIAILSIMAL